MRTCGQYWGNNMVGGIVFHKHNFLVEVTVTMNVFRNLSLFEIFVTALMEYVMFVFRQ